MGGADNELVRADINEKLKRGWRLVMLTPGPGVDTVELVWDSVELVWDASGASGE